MHSVLYVVGKLSIIIQVKQNAVTKSFFFNVRFKMLIVLQFKCKAILSTKKRDRFPWKEPSSRFNRLTYSVKAILNSVNWKTNFLFHFFPRCSLVMFTRKTFRLYSQILPYLILFSGTYKIFELPHKSGKMCPRNRKRFCVSCVRSTRYC